MRDEAVARAEFAGESGPAAIVWLVENVRDNRGLFAAVAGTIFCFALAYALLATPIYTTDALIRVEPTKSSMIGPLADLGGALQMRDPSVLGEIEILKSRATIGSALEQVSGHLSVRTLAPLPLMAGVLPDAVRKYLSQLLDAAPPTWGSDALKFETFEVPAALIGVELEFIVGLEGAWRLVTPDGAELASGNLHEPVTAGDVRVHVSELNALPGTRFQVIRHSLQARIRDVATELRVAETSPQSNAIRVKLDNADPVFASRLVNAIADAYVGMNVRRRSEEAARSLKFLDEQLPQLRAQLDRAEAAFNEFRMTAGTIDIGGQVTELLQRVTELERQRMELELRRGELVARFEPLHPTVAAVDAQIVRIQHELDQLAARRDSLPLVQQNYLRLARDVEVSTQLYVSLLNNAQQLRIAKAGTVENAVIIDRATPAQRPTSPNRPLIVMLGALLAVGAGVTVCQIFALSVARVRDTDTLERVTGMDTLAVVPHAREQRELDRLEGQMARLIVREQPQSPTSDALRSLRMALQVRMPATPNGRVLLLSSAEPSQGKTFIACNLAQALASSGARVLLLDADLYRGAAHRYLGLPAHQLGLGRLLQGECTREQVTIEGAPGFSVIPAGRRVANPADLLASGALQALVAELRSQYDWVIVDGPPASIIGDAATLARLADQVIFVARHGKVSYAQVRQSVAAMRRLGAKFVGAVFNDHRRPAFSYGYGYGYGYAYTRADGEGGADGVGRFGSRV